MCTSCAMMASRVTPPTEEEGAEMDGVEDVERVTVLVRGRFGQSWASLYLTVAVSMTHMVGKCGDSG